MKMRTKFELSRISFHWSKRYSLAVNPGSEALKIVVALENIKILFEKPFLVQGVYRIQIRYLHLFWLLRRKIVPFLRCTNMYCSTLGYTATYFLQLSRYITLCSYVHWRFSTVSNLFHVILSSVAHSRDLMSKYLMCRTKPSLWGFGCCISPWKLQTCRIGCSQLKQHLL